MKATAQKIRIPARSSVLQDGPSFLLGGVKILIPFSLIRFSVVILFLVSLSAQTLPPDPICPGDINLDTTRGPGDLALLTGYITGQRILEGEALANADVNLDRVIDVGDLTRLMKHATGELPLIPCGDFSPLEIACPLLIFERASAQPLERVGIGTLPEEFSELVAAFVVSADNHFSLVTFVEGQEDGSSTLFTPFYPGATLDGGAVKVQVTDGRVTCPPLDFSIEAIPPAPGEFSRVVDAIQEIISKNAQEVGLTPEDLLKEGADLPPYAIPQALAQALLDDPEDPNSIRSLGNGTAPLLEGNGDAEFLDAMASHLRLLQLFESDSNSASTSTGAPAGDLATSPQVSHGAAQLGLDNCDESAEKLHYCMGVAKAAQKGPAGPIERKVLEDINKTVSVVGTLAGFGTQVFIVRRLVSMASSALGISLAFDAARWSQEGLANLLPSSLVHLELRLNPSVMEEDRVDGFEDSLLTAANKGWKLDARRIVSEVFQQAGVDSLLESAPGTILREIGESSISPEWLSLPKETSTKELEEKIIDLVVEKGNRYAPGAFKGPVMEIAPRSFGPVFLDGYNWKETEVKGNAVRFIGSDVYEPAEVGTADIIVRVRTDGGRFGGVPPISAAKPIEVKPIILDVTPDRVVAKPGEQVNFTVTVENSFFPEKVEVTAERGNAKTTYAGGARHTVAYTVPAKEKLPDVLTARHTAKTGARRLSAEPRVDQAEIRGQASIIILPDRNCVEPSETTGIFHSVEGIADQRVTWETETIPSGASAGVVSGGSFFAPGTPAYVLVTATSVADPAAKGEAIVKVGGCDCWWTVSIAGNHTTGVPGVDSGAFLFEEEGLIILLGRPSPPQFLEIAPADPTRSSFGVAGSIGLVSPDINYASLETISGSLFEVDENIFEGQVSGMVTVVKLTSEGPVERLAPFSVRFKVSEEPNALLPPVKGCFVQ